MRRLNVLFLPLLLFAMYINAGCENIGGSAKIEKMEIGKKAPDFVLQDASGKVWNLSTLKGKEVLVN